MNTLVKRISKAVKIHPHPVVLIGGGLDSGIILYHLREKTKDPIHTFTFGFKWMNREENEFEAARRKAEYYDTEHHEVTIGNLLTFYPDVLKQLPKPAFTLWVSLVLDRIHREGFRNVYLGEGADEHFGGYWYKKQQYMETWANFYEYGLKTYRMLFRLFPGLWMHTPFLKLTWLETYPYYDHSNRKNHLRRAYKGVLPDWLRNQRKKPASINYRKFWARELRFEFPNYEFNGASVDAEIRGKFQEWVTRKWLEARKS